ATSAGTRQLPAAADEYAARAARDLDRQLGDLRAYLDTVAARRRDFEAWIAELRRLAGSHADQIPPPPELPEPPAALTQLLATGPVLPKPAPPAAAGARAAPAPLAAEAARARSAADRAAVAPAHAGRPRHRGARRQRRPELDQHLRPERSRLQRDLHAARDASRRVARPPRRAR